MTTRSLIAPPSGGGERVNLPAGQYVARSYIVADLGTHNNQYMGEERLQRQIIMTFETPEETHLWKDSEGPMPFSISSRFFTFSMAPKSNLRSLLGDYRGKSFTDQEAAVFDIGKVLGVPCLITVEHTEKGDKTYVNIKSICPVPKQIVVPPPINKPVLYTVTDGVNCESFKSLPQWMQKKVMESIEITNPDFFKTKPPVAPEDPADEAERLGF